MAGIGSPFLVAAGAPATPFLQAEAWRARQTEEHDLEHEAPRDDVDPFLVSRRSRYQVALVGTRVQVTLSRDEPWTRQYTSRALTEGALGAALGRLFMGGATPAQARKAHDQVLAEGVKFTPADKAAGSAPQHTLLIDEAALKKLAAALNVQMPQQMATEWRLRFGEARLLQFAVHKLRDTFDSVVPHLPARDLAAAGLSAPFIRELLDKRAQAMIEQAKRHAATGWWREAFKRNLALQAGEREPTLADFPVVPVAQWAKTLLQLAAATREALRRQLARAIEARRKEARNRHLNPQEVAVDDAARFILETFDPTRTERLHTTQWEIRGGQRLTNIKNQPIFLLRVDSGHVVFQNLADKKFYRQTLEGFGEEQLYSIYALAGQKAHGAIALTKWVLGLAGAVFPVVRYGLLAADVINAGHKLQANRAEIERHYAGFRLAYANIDGLLPGVLPKVWEAVLDKRNLALFNPLQNPDAGAWLKAVIRVVMMRTARVARASYAADAVSGFLKKSWAAIKKGADALWEVIKHVIVLAPAVAGSTGTTGHRALALAQQRLRELGVADAAAVVSQIRNLSRDDQQRLSREIQELITSGTQLLAVIEQSMSW